MELLKKYGGAEVKFQKKKNVYAEGDKALFYFQIKRGIVKLNTFNSDGSEIIFGMFSDNDSFGEAPIYGGFPYPCSAVTVSDTALIKLDIAGFTSLIRENFAYCLEFNRIVSERASYSTFILKEVLNESTEHKILSLLDYFKEKHIRDLGLENARDLKKFYTFPYTRQELAAMLGLRVETVIRHCLKLCEKREISIKQRKILRAINI